MSGESLKLQKANGLVEDLVKNCGVKREEDQDVCVSAKRSKIDDELEWVRIYRWPNIASKREEYSIGRL